MFVSPPLLNWRVWVPSHDESIDRPHRYQDAMLAVDIVVKTGLIQRIKFIQQFGAKSVPSPQKGWDILKKPLFLFESGDGLRVGKGMVVFDEPRHFLIEIFLVLVRIVI